jgi:hypothetical protein
MTISVGSFLLLLCSLFTGLIVEAIKKMWVVDKPNVLAAIVSVVVGTAVPVSYIIVMEITINAPVILFIVSMVVLSWLSAMLGYDKVIQTINQLRR